LKTILHVIDTTGPGGAETVFIDLATRLPKEKYRSVVVIRGKGWVYEELCRRGKEPFFLDAKGSFNWRYLRGLIRLIRQEKVDLIQSHLLGANVYCSFAGMLTRTPVVATFHGEIDIGINERLKALKMWAINFGANCIIAVSGGLRDDMLSRTNLNKRKIHVIYNGIDTAAFERPRSKSLKTELGWPEQIFLVGCLGNIRSAKGYDILLNAAALLKEEHTDFRFVIAGQPDKAGLYERLLELRESLGLTEKVKFLGFLDESEQYLSNLDLFLSSSTTEGLPLSAIQAMAAKLPLLATRCGGYEELVSQGENGWLVEVGSPEAIASAIRKLAASPEMRSEMARKAQMHVQAEFDSQVMFDRYQAIYDALM